MIVIDTDLIKSYIENDTVKSVVFNGDSLNSLTIDGEQIWYPCYKGHTAVTDAAVAATCTTTGLTEGSHCSVCGEVIVPQTVIAALGHSWKITYSWNGTSSCVATRTCSNNSSHTERAIATITSAVTKAATCTTAGVRTYTATFSESWATAQTKTEVIPATGHSYSDATCTTPMTCSVCGATGGSALGHDYGAWTVTLEPTCGVSGTSRRDCSRCDAYETTSIPATGNHTWSNATCTTPMTCSVCGTTSGSALGHRYTAVVIAPTCTAQGYTAHICENCGDRYDDTYTAATGHTSSDWIIDVEATTTSTGSKHKECTICGTVLETATIPKIIPKLSAPNITDAVLSGDVIDLAVHNYNPVEVECWVVIEEDRTGSQLNAVQFTIASNTTGYQTVQISSSFALPLLILAHFEVEGYYDSDETSETVS